MTIQENLELGVKKLKKENISEPVLKARLLLCYILNLKKEDLVIYGDKEINSEDEKKYEKVIKKLTEGNPLQYITHHSEFMKLNFYVNENVLIPRADTEITVEEVISYCKNMKKSNIRILDLCTGSGVIAISIGNYIKNCEIIAVDISSKALEIAKSNANNNNVDNITWILSDLFEKVEGKFDIIVSNPPYIKKEVIPTLETEVQKEPIIALDGGQDGLEFYRQIIKKAPNYLEKGGKIFLEIGYDQKQEVLDIINETREYEEIISKKDLSGNDRMIMAKYQKER